MGPTNIAGQQAKSTKGSWQTTLPTAKTLKKEKPLTVEYTLNIQRVHSHRMELAAASTVTNNY